MAKRDSTRIRNSRQRSEWLKREEVRAVFAIGVVASVLSLPHIVVPIIFWVPSVGSVNLDVVLRSTVGVFWGGYILAMAIGVSDDLMGDRPAAICKTVAYLFFKLGILLFAMFWFATWIAVLAVYILHIA